MQIMKIKKVMKIMQKFISKKLRLLAKKLELKNK